MTPAVSVVVPVLNMAETVGPCVEALLAQTIDPALREIIIVDNGSTDGTRDVVARYPVTLLHEARPGAPNARNAGIKAASGTFVAFTDADCIPSRRWLAHLAQAAGNGEYDIIAGPLAVLDPERSLLSRYAAALGQYDPRRSLSHPVFPYAVTGNVCVRRSTLEAVGLFNPAFRTFDSAEFFWRLRQRGELRATMAPKALVFYRTRSNLPSFVAQNFGYGRGTGRLLYHARATGVGSPHRAALRGWRNRMRDAARIARTVARTSTGAAVPAYALHLLRETSIAAGILASVVERM
jgi:glycosyltransferase involved in cell wall biosynthesis